MAGTGKPAGYVLVAVIGGIAGGIVNRLLDSRLGDFAELPSQGTVRPFTEIVERGRPRAARSGLVEVVRRVGPAVVNISTIAREAMGGAPLSDDELREGEGSGFIINGREGLVVTNNHVVEAAQQIEVALADKRTLKAQVVGTDPIGDVAVLRLKGGGRLPELKLADSDKLAIGQTTIAIGNPLGFANTVTVGVLSQIGRELDGQVRGVPLGDLLQTDAAINPGNSGGPLLDENGNVIGMNTAIISQAQGLGFAVASNTLKRSVTDIIQHGRVIRSWIGVEMTELTPETARVLHVPATPAGGVVVPRVRRRQPAERAGMQPGDVITEVNGKPVTTTGEVRNQIQAHRPGETILLRGFRGDQKREWKVKIAEMPPPQELGR